MGGLRILVLLCVFALLSCNASANALGEEIFVPTLAKNSNFFASVRNDEGQWIVDRFQMANDGWQDLVAHSVFSTHDAARTSLQGWTSLTGHRIQHGLLHFPRQLRDADSALWTVTANWNWQWEQKYADWIMQNAGPDFFNKYKLATDCADVAYALRWIFARNNGLPAAARLAGTSSLFSQDSVRSSWADLPTSQNWFEDQRFLTALNYLLDNTYTHTLIGDSYPIEVTPTALLAGSHFLRLFKDSGHTQFIHRTFYNDPTALPIRLMWSTVPRTVRSLMETEFWESIQPKQAEGGILRFQWAIRDNETGETSLLSPEKMPFYSTRQYTTEFMDGQQFYALAVMNSLNPGFSYEKWMSAGIEAIRAQVLLRAETVQKGFAICGQSKNLCPPGSSGYEDWSTPSRDLRIAQLIQQLETIAQNSIIGNVVGPIWRAAQDQVIISINGISYTLKQMGWVWSQDMYSSEPWISIAGRWGFAPLAFSDNLTAKLQSKLDARAGKITAHGSACGRTNCRMGSEQWMKWSTYSEDQDAEKLRAAYTGYCERFSSSDCDEFKSRSSFSSIMFGEQKLTLPKALDSVTWLNSDPNQDAAIRWGSFRNKYHSAVLPANDQQLITASGWYLNLTHPSATLVNLVTGAKFTQAVDVQWKWLDLNEKWAAAISPSVLKVLNISTGQIHEVSLNGFYSSNQNLRDFALAGDRYLLLRNSDTRRALVIDLNSMDFAVKTVIENVVAYNILNSHFSQSSNFIVLRSSNMVSPTQIYDLEHALKIEVGRDPSGNIIRSGTAIAETATSVLFNFCSPWCSAYVYDKVKLSLRPNAELRGAFLYLADASSLLAYNVQNQNQTFVRYFVDADFHLRGQQTMGLFLSDLRQPLLCAFVDNEEQNCFRYDGKSIGTQPIYSDRHISAWDERLVSFHFKGEKENHLARFNDLQNVLISSPEIFRRVGDATGWFFTAAKSGLGEVGVVDSRHPDFGNVVTATVSSNVMFNSTLKAERGISIELPSHELLWIDSH